LSESDLVLNTQ